MVIRGLTDNVVVAGEFVKWLNSLDGLTSAMADATEKTEGFGRAVDEMPASIEEEEEDDDAD